MTATPPTPAEPATPALCEGIGSMIEAARVNYPDIRKMDKPVEIDHVAGFEATFVFPDTTGCRILTSEPPYPDAYECDLSLGDPPKSAKVVVDRWVAMVEKCPQIASWPRHAYGAGVAWEIETNDNHMLNVHVLPVGDDETRPTLGIRLNEI